LRRRLAGSNNLAVFVRSKEGIGLSETDTVKKPKKQLLEIRRG
jgi:hypothetical protein